MSDEARVFITAMKFVSVNDKGEEITSNYGFTIWDGETNHFFVAGDSWWDSAAGVFEVLRGDNALEIIEKIDNYDVGFAEIAKMAGGFSINYLAIPADWKPENPSLGEWIKVSDKPRCFGHYPVPYLNVVNDREFECQCECIHCDGCKEVSNG